MKKVLGLVVARGGSKRIPRKNIKLFLNKPLIGWSIDTAKSSGIFDRIIISTDDEEITTVAKKHGAEAPFRRPVELALDTTLVDDTIRHAIKWLADNESYQPDWVFLLEPTAPAKQVFHFKDAMKIIDDNKNFDSLIGVSEIPSQYTYLMQITLDQDNLVRRAWDQVSMQDMPKSSREIKKSYLPNPQIYAFKPKNLFEGQGTMYGNSTYGYMMDSKYNIDIDTPDDWILAEAKMKKILEEEEL